jgi:hypothetical protein
VGRDAGVENSDYGSIAGRTVLLPGRSAGKHRLNADGDA